MLFLLHLQSVVQLYTSQVLVASKSGNESFHRENADLLSPLNVYQNVHKSERTPTFSTKYGCHEIENRIPVLTTHCPVIFRNFNQDTERYRKIQIETERRLMTHPGQHPHQKLINPPVLAIFLCR